jgi:flagellar biosynthetic protein FliP
MFLIGIILTFLCVAPTRAYATETSPTPTSTALLTPSPGFSIDGVDDSLSFNYNTGEGTGSLSSTLQIMLLLSVISLAPSILIMMTSFIRTIIVLHFVRSALGTQTTPPNQVLTGLALFLTLFIMSPIFMKINTEALQPLNAGEITQEEAFTRGLEPIRGFMFDQTDGRDLNLFLEISGTTIEDDGDNELTRDDVPTTVLIPSFILSELRYAFIIGFLIYLPFLVIDMVVASTLMSMGMMMLPPTTISMPFKILLFVLADGWNLIIGELVKTFYSTS